MRNYNYHPFITEWMQAVERGYVHSCKEMKQLMSFIRTVLSDSNVEFRVEIVEEYVRIAEQYYFPLMPDQKFYAALILGLFYKDTGLLVFNQIFIMAGRGWGKNGFISTLVHFMISEHHGVRKYNVDIVATSEEQAMTSFCEVYDCIDEMGAKGKRLYQYNKTQIQDRKTKSILRFRTSNAKTKDGGRPGCVIFDEIHQYENYQNIKVFTGGLGKVDLPRRIYITSDGEVRDGVLDDYKERCRKILMGEIKHNGFLPIIMKLDTIQEVGKKELWDKANPRINYNLTLKHEIETEYEEMLENESLKEAFITKRMNLVYISKTRTVCEWEDLMTACKQSWPDLIGEKCIGSIDFAELSDFASAGLRLKKNGKHYFRQHTWIHEKALQLKNYNIDIDECVRMGWATIVKEKDHLTIPAELIAEWFHEQAAAGYYIQKIKIDNFRWPVVKEVLEKAGLPEIELVRSGPITYNKVAPVIDNLFANQQLGLEDDKLMRWYIWNTAREKDKKGNINYYKIEPERRKTDGFFCFVHGLIEDELEETKELQFYDVVTY